MVAAELGINFVDALARALGGVDRRIEPCEQLGHRLSRAS